MKSSQVRKGDIVQVAEMGPIGHSYEVGDHVEITSGVEYDFPEPTEYVDCVSMTKDYPQAIAISALKFILGLACVLVMTSCSTLHKVTTKVAKVDDTTQNKAVDSTAKSTTSDSSDYVYLSDANIEVVYGADTVKAIDTFKNKNIQALHDIVKAVSGNRVPQRVTVHIAKFVDSSINKKTFDSVKVVTADNRTVRHESTVQTVDISRKSYVIFGIVVFLFVAIFVIIKFKLL